MAEFTTVFLSSTTKDLQPWRDAVYEAIGRMAGLHCVRMEDFGPIDASPLKVCRAKAAECDLFVGLVGHLFGSRPEGSELSCTQVEYEEAKARKKPRLMFLAGDDVRLSPGLGRESEDASQRQMAFRRQVQRERTVVTFDEPDKLATLVVAALQSHLDEAQRGATRRAKEGPSETANGSRLTAVQIRSRATWIFGSLFVAYLIIVFYLAPDSLPTFKQRILAVFSALLAGLFAYFFTGELGVSIEGGSPSAGKLAVKGFGGAAAFVLVLIWWLSPLSPIVSLDLVRLRVLVLGPSNVPVDDAKVWTSIGGEPKQVSGGWEFDIPLSKVPTDGRVSVYAAKESAFLRGSQEVVLAGNLAPSVTLHIRANRSETVRGEILDAAGKPLSGVRVSVVGYTGETMTTGPDGQFVLPAHAADGQTVQLHAEKPGYAAISQFHLAGAFPATLTLEER